MLRRFLIRLHFAPGICKLFDLLPAIVQLAWFAETATATPTPVYGPPGVSEGVGPPKSRSRRLVNALVVPCFVALASYGLGGWGLVGLVFLIWAFILLFRRIRRRA